MGMEEIVMIKLLHIQQALIFCCNGDGGVAIHPP